MIGVNRFYHVYHIASGLRDPNRIDQYEQQFRQQFWQEQYNHEQNYIQLNQIIVDLDNSRRAALFDLCGELLGTTFSLKKVAPNNDLSPSYIDVGGQNISVSSSGTRLLMTILGICMDESFSSMLIDEPELGLGPRIQASVSGFLQDAARRRQYFPHLQQVFVATHSHIFLHRGDLQSNFVVSKREREITIKRVASISDFHRLQFNLLGNELETLFIPSAIVIVEGKTDQAYLDKVISARFPGRNITILSSQGDVKRRIAALRDVLGDFTKSPLRDRVFVVLDSVHQPGLRNELATMGVVATNIVRWDANGIEYLYPSTIVSTIFSCDQSQHTQLRISDDRVEMNGIVHTKAALSDEVLARMTAETQLPMELETKLLAPLAVAIG